MTDKKTFSDIFFSFLLKNFKFALVIFILPQIFLTVYNYSVDNKNCIGSTRILISKAVSNFAIVDEILMNNLDLNSLTNVELFGGDRVIFKGSNISECKENYKKVSSMVDKMNSHIEEFYFEQLSSEERARFANPLLFNYIGSTKIQYARLLPLDLNTFKEKDKTRNRFYTLIFSFFILILYFILKIKKNKTTF